MKNQHVKDAIDKVVEALRTGDIKRIAYAVFKSQRGRPSDLWSFFNRLIMFASDTEDARGFRQWQRTGRHLLKGTKALYILGPVKYKTRIKVTNGDGEEEVVKEEIRTGFKSIPVYRVEDTGGKPLEEDNFELRIPANLSQVAEGLGLDILTKRFTGDSYGYFSAARKEIALMSPELDVYLHELSHAVDNDLNGELQGGQQPDQEIVAELSAEVVAYLLGHRLNGRSRDYIADYSAGNWKPVFALLNRVNCVVQYIVEKAQIEEGEASSSIDFIAAAGKVGVPAN
jgi:hypothetical protein